MTVERLRAAGCVYAEEEAALLAAAPGDTDALVARRCAGEPLEQVLGWASFCGLRIGLAPGVFVPRQRSTHLVAVATRLVPADALLVEACCGSGAVGLAVAAATGARLVAGDLDPAAVACARTNGVAAYVGDLLEPIACADVVLANAPYVPTAELPLLPAEARLHEPALALDGGTDGLAVQRRLLAQCAERRVPLVLVETGRHQAGASRAAAAAVGYDAETETDDELRTTVLVARRMR